MINVGVIGCGQWGPNHVRNFSHLKNSTALMCADLSEERLKVMKETFLNIQPTKDYKEILNNPDIHAVCITTPTATHYQFTKEALEHGKHVLCEKPLALKSNEVQELIEIAQRNNCLLMVGHVFLFNAGILKLKEYLSKNELGNIQYAHATRTNLGPFRYDVNALWDLAPHDISIFNYLFASSPIEVSARGHKCLSSDREDLAFVNLEYPNNILVNIQVSWLDPKKVRQITLVGSEKMASWDDLATASPIALYDKKVEQAQTYYETFGEFQLLSREGDVILPKVNLSEPLKEQDAYFINCIEKKINPDVADGLRALEVIKTLEAVQESMNRNGAPIQVEKIKV